MEWSKLDFSNENPERNETFEKIIPSFIRLSPKGAFNSHNPREIKLLLRRRRLGLSHLREHSSKPLLKFC